jgi:alpha-D-ribose 1-methylphosphonate 5-triphosphate synthase subunit PhnG
MFHPFDNAGPNRSTRRPEWMALLARAPLTLLENALADQPAQTLQWLRRPETGLYMVQGRAGGTGERFNLGEITVTRCALRATADDGAPVGVAYVKGRNHRQAQLAALADALLQDAAQHEALEQALLDPIRQHLAGERALRATRARATTVDFFTVAREAGTDQDDEEGAE